LSSRCVIISIIIIYYKGFDGLERERVGEEMSKEEEEEDRRSV
jgi:hypothetical protein